MQLCVNRLLNVWIDADHSCIQVWMVSHQHLWVPSHRYKYSLQAGRQWLCDSVADLEADEEREGYHYRRKSSICVVGRMREDQVEVGQESSCKGHEDCAHGEDGSNTTKVSVESQREKNIEHTGTHLQGCQCLYP